MNEDLPEVVEQAMQRSWWRGFVMGFASAWTGVIMYLWLIA